MMFALLASPLGLVLGDSAFDASNVSILTDGFIKLLFVVAFALYSIFAFIVTRQISNMRRTLETTASLPIRLAGYLHFAAAVGLFLLALIVL